MEGSPASGDGDRRASPHKGGRWAGLASPRAPKGRTTTVPVPTKGLLGRVARLRAKEVAGPFQSPHEGGSWPGPGISECRQRVQGPVQSPPHEGGGWPGSACRDRSRPPSGGSWPGSRTVPVPQAGVSGLGPAPKHSWWGPKPRAGWRARAQIEMTRRGARQARVAGRRRRYPISRQRAGGVPHSATPRLRAAAVVQQNATAWWRPVAASRAIARRPEHCVRMWWPIEAHVVRM